MKDIMTISVIGLGKLGSPLVATLASKGFDVLGVDINQALVLELNKGKTSFNEANLSKYLQKFKSKIKATTDINEAILNSEITFIIVPTPSEKSGKFSLKYVEDVIKKISQALKQKKTYHLVSITSTVMPGATQKIQKMLEDDSGKVCGRDFGLCYNPEFIALGSVINDLLNPDFVLIGESDKKAGEMLEKFYKKYCSNKPKISRMNFINAELTKISVNTFITTKISYANMLAEICEKLGGGNVDAVTQALGLDSRIGSKYLKGAVSFGGPCFPRDNVAFTALAKDLKVSAFIPEATQKTNISQITRLTKKILKLAATKKNVGILGLSYKPFTDVVEESTGIHLAKMLLKKGVKLKLHDPLALENAKKVIGKNAEYYTDLDKLLKKSQIIVIATSWPEYSKINTDLLNLQKAIIDPWRILNRSNISKDVDYFPIGLNI